MVTFIVGLVFCAILVVGSILSFFFFPKKPNSIFGFRTKRSSSSQEAWIYANKLSDKIFIGVGVLSTLAVISVYFIEGMFSRSLDDLVADVLIGTIAALILSVIFVQVLLCKRFDSNGNRKSG